RATDEDAGTAWRVLLGAVGRFRARWVAQATLPINVDRRETDPAPQFGEVPPRRKAAAIARLLPDAFTAVAIQGVERSAQTGRAILPQVTVGLFASDSSELREVNGIKVISGAEWLVDYKEAERVGMAVTVPLRRRGMKIDQLFVFGVRSSLDAKAGAL